MGYACRLLFHQYSVCHLRSIVSTLYFEDQKGEYSLCFSRHPLATMIRMVINCQHLGSLHTTPFSWYSKTLCVLHETKIQNISPHTFVRENLKRSFLIFVRAHGIMTSWITSTGNSLVLFIWYQCFCHVVIQQQSYTFFMFITTCIYHFEIINHKFTIVWPPIIHTL